LINQLDYQYKKYLIPYILKILSLRLKVYLTTLRSKTKNIYLLRLNASLEIKSQLIYTTGHKTVNYS